MNIKRTCFVIMPYDKKTIDIDGERREVDFDKVYEAIIEPAIASLSNPKLLCLRADRDARTGIVSAKVMRHIQESAVCVVDVSGDNPNVYYELGIRHALSRGVTALIGYKGTALPFIVRGIAVLNYGYDTVEEVERAKTALKEYISGSFAKHEVDSPVHRFLDLRVTQTPLVCERFETVAFSLKSDPTKSLGYVTGEITGISGIDDRCVGKFRKHLDGNGALSGTLHL